MLGLDQKTLRPYTPNTDDNEDATNETLDREQLAWTCTSSLSLIHLSFFLFIAHSRPFVNLSLYTCTLMETDEIHAR